GLSTVTWIVGVILYMIGFYCSHMPWLSVIPRAVISSFKMFVVVNDLARVEPMMREDPMYMSVFSIVHLVAAYITFLFIFKIIGFKMKSIMKINKHRWFMGADEMVHVFWGVNDASCLLAKSIKDKSSADVVIFVDVDEETEDSTNRKTTLANITNSITLKNSDIIRLNHIGAMVDHCFGGPASIDVDDCNDVFGALRLNSIGSIIKKSRKTNFYFLSDDQAGNILAAINIQADYRVCSKTKDNVTIYVHARKNSCNEVFDHYAQYNADDALKKTVKIVDSAYLALEWVKKEKQYLPVNNVDIEKGTGLVKDSSFTSMIVGFGETGIESFKFLYEFAAFVGTDMKKIPFKCYAIDQNMDKKRGAIRAKMPAINEDELSLVTASVDSDVFWEVLKKEINNLNYIFITLNDDNVGLSLAVNIFKYAVRCRKDGLSTLKIMIRCYNVSNEKKMKEVKNSLNRSIDGQKVEICMFGLMEDLYNYDTILSNAVLNEAKEFNRVYNDSKLSADEQWEKDFVKEEIDGKEISAIDKCMEKEKISRYHAIYDINRRIEQNISNVLHKSTKMILMDIDDEKMSHRLEEYNDYVDTIKDNTICYECGGEAARLLHNIAYVEHERWVASHKLMGYVGADEKNYVKKHHNCIKHLDELSDSIKYYDGKVANTTIKLIYNKLSVDKNNPSN
ncbi:MAG: hypothetical protein II371_05645, partial [Flavobacteriales bacterium]|nr:hypothetical protein [Flavobacteriales bacterium]